MVEIGPPQGRYRRVSVWAPLPTEPCEGKGDGGEVVLEPPGWTRDTIATPREIHQPDGRLTDDPEAAAIKGSAVLQPDRRTIVVAYSYGGCNDLAQASATLAGSVATVDVRTGAEPDLPEDVRCPGVQRLGFTAVRLPTAAPPGTTVTVVPCERPCS